MLTYDQINVTVRRDNVTSLLFRMNEGYDGFSFYAETDKLCAFLRGGREAPDVLKDVFRVAIRFMERITFCDLADVMDKGEARPTISVTPYNMTLPYEAGRILADQIEAAARGLGDRHDVSWGVTLEDRAHWMAFYGIGKGSVRIEFSNDAVKNKFEALLSEYAAVPDRVLRDGHVICEETDTQRAKRTWERSMTTLKAVAKNTTGKVTDVGVVRLGPDGRGFTFTAGGMFGGLIWHVASGEWSVHT